jgi:hypothetical protein
MKHEFDKKSKTLRIVNKKIRIMKIMNLRFPVLLIIMTLLITACDENQKKSTLETDENGFVVLTDDQVENMVKRSYQYVAMYNVNNKFAISQGGWNTLKSDTEPKDHTMTDIARPNNDTYYTGIMLDLRTEPLVIKLPAFNSDYVSLMVTAYDHYVNIPKTTRVGDFEKPETILLYSSRTEGYNREPVEGVDEIFKCSGDFVSAVVRTMPHLSEPERYAKVLESISEIGFETLSEFQGKEPKAQLPVDFPDIGKTDAEIFENNLLEVMQFVMNHVDFNAENDLDAEVLKAYKPLGIEPGKTFDPETAIKIDGEKFREASLKVRDEYLAMMQDPIELGKLTPMMFQPKGNPNLETLLLMSITGPIGMPMEEAIYPAVNTSDGTPMNAMNDYVIKMTKDELPPSGAFWSITLYDEENGFFIPNERKKYSVGKNAGFVLNEEGGIDIYITAEKPEGVPPENWLPVNREDLDLNLILRSYETDLEKYKTWKPPMAEKL